MEYLSTKLSRYVIVLGLLCVLGETPVRLYGHLKLIEARHVKASESDLLTFLELAFGQITILLTPLGLPISFVKPSNSVPFMNILHIIGATTILLAGRSLGGCGG